MKLLPHQTEAVEKFQDVPNVLIGDKMGVGKTVTAIGRDLDLRKRYGRPGAHIRTLIICQKSGLSVWRDHLLKFGIPDKKILVVNPKDRVPFERALAKGAIGHDYYVVHWDVLTRLEDINSRKPAIEWHHVIADEAHLMKNRKSARTREVKKLKAFTKTALSGTPADDKPQDLWSVLNWLYPRIYKAYWKFWDAYIEWETGYTGYRKQTGVKNLEQLHNEIGPFYIRRSLEDVRNDMPKKSYTDIKVQLTPKQARDYERMRKFHIGTMNDDGDELIAPVAVAVITRLQQMTAGTCRVDWTTEEWDAYYDALNAYDEAVETWEVGGRRGIKPRRPKGPPVHIDDPSPKIDALFELIDENEDEKFVVFTNYPSVADLVVARCQSKKIEAVSYTGADTNQANRDAAVASFQGGSARVFVGTIGAAGTTITLNSAHTLIFLDRHWNPSKNEQAEDRIYRIDNDAIPVQIIDIIAEDTIDEYKIEQIGNKMSWLRDFLTPPSQK